MSNHHPETEEHHSRHPTLKQYVVVAAILFAITLVEFLIIVPETLQGSAVVVAPLIILSALKFAIVIMFYMHLKFDARLYSWIFLGGLSLGALVLVAMLLLFDNFRPEPRDFAEAFAEPYEGHEEAAAPHEGQGPPQSEGQQPPPPPPGGPEPQEPPPPPPEAGGAGELVAEGQAIFTGTGGCGACHTIEGLTSGMVGPDLTHIGTEAAERKPGMSAQEYIDESIRMPEAFVAPDVERATPGIMTSALTAGLSDAEVEALVEFLLAQK